MFNDDIYTTMMENNETWFTYQDGSAMIITNVPPMDC